MNISCGIDIIEIKRIKEDIEKIGNKFLERIFTENEIKYCESKKTQKYQSYAGRFAAKEATFKAISNIIDNEEVINWKDFEVINNNYGRPSIVLKNMNIKDIESIDISISHCEKYAIANVTVLYKD